jgi:uncharacterized protein (DUF2252 family)
MDIRETTTSDKEWARGCGAMIYAELQDKLAKMEQDPFLFLRESYYRWVHLWPESCSDSRRALIILFVYGLRTNSYGAWHDETRFAGMERLSKLRKK